MEISINVDSNSDTLTSFHSYEYFVQGWNTENAAINCEIINENPREDLNPVNNGIFALSNDNIIEMKVDICGNNIVPSEIPNNTDFQDECRQTSPTKLYALNKEENCNFQPSEIDQESPELSAYPQNFDLNESYNNLENIAIDEQSNTSNINADKDLFYVNKDDFEILNINYTTKEDVDSANSSRETKCIIPDAIPVLANSFLTMENSSNATDNCNAMTNNIICSIPEGSDPNHIFKLPNNELTFNGTLKHLQKLKPIVNTDTTFQSQFKDDFKDVFTSDVNKESSVDDFSNKSNDYITSSPSADASNSKCNLTISSDSQYPSDYDIFLNVLSRTPTGFSNVEENQDLDSNTTFSHNEMTVLKSKDVTLDNTYNSGMCSPTLFSDNEDEIYNTYEEIKVEKEKSFQQFNEYDKKLVEKLKKSLMGIPPPPSITISQLTAADILQMYKTNLPKYDCIGSSLDPMLNSTTSLPVNCDSSADKTILNCSNDTLDKTVCEKPQKSANISNTSEKLININGTQDLAINEKWPEIRSCRYYGIHYNCSNHSEDIDSLLCRYILRYIGCETASSCLAIPYKRSPAKKSLRSNIGQSPGRRLSHLARRRISFCNADNLKQTFSAKRQILIDRTKYSDLFLNKAQTRKSPRKKTPKKVTPLKRTPKSKTPKKKGPNSSQKKKTTRRLFSNDPSISKLQPTKETSKRALFLSPENIPIKPIEEPPPCASTSKIIKSKRALFNTPQKEADTSKTTSNCNADLTKNESNNRKRFRLDDSISEMEYGPRLKLHRSLSFGGDKIESTAQELSTTIIKHASEQILNKSDVLSDLHKKKLLWAVAEALRCHSIGVKHDKFRLHMSSLARLTRKISQLPHHARTLRTPGNSTSETLRRIARQHAFSVIRGKPIEEILIEEQTKHSNPQPKKLVGYVPLNSHDSNKQSHSNFVLNKNSENSYDNDKNFKNLTSNDSKTVLQDKTINLNLKTNDFSNKLLVSEQKKSLLFKDNSKLHTCRQMNFDMNNFKR